jgi:cytoskeletal protein CcmA (bactofilin family)
MFRVGKSSNAPDQPKPAPPPPPPAQQGQAAQPTPPQPARPPQQQQPAATTAQARTAPAAPPPPPATQSQQQQRAQVESQTLATRAVSESESLARAVKEGAVGGFVGGTSELAGEVNFRGMMRVDGKVTGRVASDDGTLIVSSGGRVEAEVSVVIARISGEVTGDITASQRVELGRTARVSGNIQTPALIVEDGAIFEGNCRMSKRREGRAGEDARRTKTAA